MTTPVRWVSAPLLGAIALLVTGAAPAFAAGPPLSAYTIFGENGVTIGFESDIVGLVGGRNNDPVAGNTAVRLNGGAKVEGDVRSGGNVNLQNNASITGTLFRPLGTFLIVNNGASVGTDAFPVDPMLPPFPAATPLNCPIGGQSFGNGGSGQSLVLTPGSYGTLNFGGNFDLTLDGTGSYFFDSITGGNGSTLTITKPGTKVFVCGAAHWGGLKMTLVPPAVSSCDFSIEVQASGNNAFQVGGDSDIIGDVFAPNGEIHIGAGSSKASFIGRQFANLIDIEHSVAGSAIDCGGPPPNDTHEFRTNKDATVLHTRKNENDGANLTLRVEAQTRSLVGFDISLVDISKVLSAKLVLTVANNPLFDVPPYSPSSNWPLNSGDTFVARLDDGFELWPEGNGNNYPTPKNPHGTGSGVTWNCEADSNIANQKPDCTGIIYWKTGGKKHQGTLIGPALQTNDMPDGTQITFDVTADVLAGLGPNDTKIITWFILVKGPGNVAYYSREGAAAAGDPSFAPTLVIEEKP